MTDDVRWMKGRAADGRSGRGDQPDENPCRSPLAGELVGWLRTDRPQAGSFGRKDANDLPMEAHHLLALCAPRPVFVSYGIPANGDALWLDQQGSFMATVAAGPAWRLLGAGDLGVVEDYRIVKLPPVETGLLEGELAWRQHAGGHESRSNMGYFIRWAERVWARAGRLND